MNSWRPHSKKLRNLLCRCEILFSDLWLAFLLLDVSELLVLHVLSGLPDWFYGGERAWRQGRFVMWGAALWTLWKVVLDRWCQSSCRASLCSSIFLLAWGFCFLLKLAMWGYSSSLVYSFKMAPATSIASPARAIQGSSIVCCAMSLPARCLMKKILNQQSFLMPWSTTSSGSTQMKRFLAPLTDWNREKQCSAMLTLVYGKRLWVSPTTPKCFSWMQSSEQPVYCAQQHSTAMITCMGACQIEP